MPLSLDGPPPSGEAAPAFEPVFSEAACAVKLQAFEGPLDLLLHLIRIEEVDIADIPIARIAEQYLEYLDVLRELHLDIAAEYLLMAATLAWIKSRMLLPPDGTTDDAEEPDPRAELVARLLEYQRFKEAAHDLDRRPLLGRDVFEARPPELEAVPVAQEQVEVTLVQLLDALRRVLQRAAAAGVVHEVVIEELTVRQGMIDLMDVLAEAESMEFFDLVWRVAGAAPTRTRVVTTFLGMLELARLSAIRIYQGIDARGVPEGPIRLRRAGEGTGADWSARISDLM
jgi:segregation and condensation protein A